MHALLDRMPALQAHTRANTCGCIMEKDGKWEIVRERERVSEGKGSERLLKGGREENVTLTRFSRADRSRRS